MSRGLACAQGWRSVRACTGNAFLFSLAKSLVPSDIMRKSAYKRSIQAPTTVSTCVGFGEYARSPVRWLIRLWRSLVVLPPLVWP